MEYISNVYDKIGEQLIWNNVQPDRWEPGITYPFAFCDTPNYICFDPIREVYAMMRGGGGGGKTGDSISEPVKGGNAAYGEKIFAPSLIRSFYVGPGGSGPEALNIHNVVEYSKSGAQGYPKAAWGGALSGFGNRLEIQDNVAGGGGGGTRNYTQGGHGGITQGVSGGSNLFEDAYGGWGAGNLNGGTSGQVGFGFPATNPEPGSFQVGGRGQILLNTNPIVPFNFAGGGGAAGYYGGGGGASGGGGGGGLSVVTDSTEYMFPGTDFGPGSRCNPYFGYEIDYGLGAQRIGRTIQDCEVWENCPDDVTTFRSGTTGINGVAATYFRSKWCTCTEIQSDGLLVPVPNYICLTQDQYQSIIDQKPTVDAPPGSEVRLSFVLDNVRYLLLYKCNLGCESKYLVSGTPSDVKWYVKNLGPPWFADFPEWSPDDVTSCCDCYDCQPLCKGPEAPIDSPTPPNVRSCDIISGTTCYLHLDDANSKWYYKCRKSNCWADFGAENLVKPYILRSMDPNTNFDCGEDPCENLNITWIANKCELITRDECCETSPCCGPEQIKFCDVYLQKLLTTYPGTYPIDLNQYCYYFKYLGCIYILSNSITTPPCIPSQSTPENPINQGDLFAITQKNGLDCCREGLFAGGTDPTATKPAPESLPCEDVIVECFDFKDQFGVAQPVRVSSPMSAPGYEPGIPYNIRCRGPNAKPDDYPVVNPDFVEFVGLCAQENSSSEVVQPLTADSFGFYRYEQASFYSCPDCLNANVICDCDCPLDGSGGGGGGGPGTYNPCDTFCEANPTFCDITAIAKDSYSIDTKYKLGPSGKFYINFGTDVNEVFYRKRVMSLKFDLCWAQSEGINIEDSAALFDFYKSKVTITSNLTKHFDKPWEHVPRCPVSVGLESTPLGAMCIKICDYEVKCFSGNAGHICEKINARINGLVEATGLDPYFWFGWRRGCQVCGTDVNAPLPKFLGDDLEFDSGQIDGTKYILHLQGVSQRWYIAVCQTLTPITAPANQVVNMSAGNNALSQAEYAMGLRYSMLSVIASSTIGFVSGICDPVVLCSSGGVYPNTDVYIEIPPEISLVKYGFQSLANFNITGIFDCQEPYRDCNVYGLDYNVSGCDGDGNILCDCLSGDIVPFGCNLVPSIIGRIVGGNITVN